MSEARQQWSELQRMPERVFRQFVLRAVAAKLDRNEGLGALAGVFGA